MFRTIGNIIKGAGKGIVSGVKWVGGQLGSGGIDPTKFSNPPGYNLPPVVPESVPLPQPTVSEWDGLVKLLTGKTVEQQAVILQEKGYPMEWINALFGRVSGPGFDIEVGTGQHPAQVNQNTVLIAVGAAALFLIALRK